MLIANGQCKTRSVEGREMKRLLVLILVLTLLVITGTLVSADAKTSATNNEFQSRQEYRTNGG
jgi:hypothetical protein